jgi:hypothetical protein
VPLHLAGGQWEKRIANWRERWKRKDHRITTKPWTLQQDVEAYKAHGVGIELWETKFSEDNYAQELDWLLGQDISISSLQPAVLTVFPSVSVPEPEDPAERVQRMCENVLSRRRSDRAAMGPLAGAPRRN